MTTTTGTNAPGQSPAFPPRRIYSVFGVPPEVQAYAMAKYSRSGQGMLESIRELSTQQAERFLNTFYFQYGHRSIADLAHIVFGLEQVSLLAAIALVDEPVWDGQERSTRYQPFRKTGWYTPATLPEGPLARAYQQAAGGLFTAYEQLSASLLDHLQDAVPRPADMEEGAYRRTLRARAFDVARALLPLATHTSVGQIVSARVAERQISRLLSSPYDELHQIAEELRSACQQPAESPLIETPAGGEVSPSISELLHPRPAATLVKYAKASDYQTRTNAALAEAAASLLRAVPEPDRTRAVELSPATPDPLDEIVATLLFAHDTGGRSYRQALTVVEQLSEAQKREVFELSLEHRGRFDEVLREHRAGYSLTFDILVDLGSFRDLHRHRRCVQVQQPLTWQHGFVQPEWVFEAGLGNQAAHSALEGGLGDVYSEALLKTAAVASRVGAEVPGVADYLLPLAYRTRCLFKMDWAEAAYLIELRSAPAGHFSYRFIAWSMYQELRDRFPALAGPIRVSNPADGMHLLER